MRAKKRMAAVAVLTAGMMAVSSGAAWAHQCFVANQPEQAVKQLANSPMWLAESMATHASYMFTLEVALGIDTSSVSPALLDEMLDEMVQEHLDQGLQEWVAFFMGHTLMTNPQTHEPTPAALMHAADGKGIDHWFVSDLGQSMMAIAQSVWDSHTP